MKSELPIHRKITTVVTVTQTAVLVCWLVCRLLPVLHDCRSLNLSFELSVDNPGGHQNISAPQSVIHVMIRLHRLHAVQLMSANSKDVHSVAFDMKCSTVPSAKGEGSDTNLQRCNDYSRAHYNPKQATVYTFKRCAVCVFVKLLLKRDGAVSIGDKETSTKRKGERIKKKKHPANNETQLLRGTCVLRRKRRTDKMKMYYLRDWQEKNQKPRR
ncbi:uncharacterized protein V6R79_000502 [Siganus canaliculatus]